MRNKFKLPSLQQLTRTTACIGALFTMVMSPVAMGAEANQINSTRLQQALDEMGVNRQITFGEFYKKNKELFPPRVQREVDPFIAQYKNQMMPGFEVVNAQATSGEQIPTLRATAGKEMVSVQWFGEKEKFAKFQNAVLTEVDVINFNDMFAKITASDEKYRKPFEGSTSAKKGINNQFEAYPAVTRDTWKKMSQKDRAGYVVNMRLLWNDARKVLIQSDKLSKKSRKTSSNETTIEKWDNLFAALSSPAEAAGRSTAKPSIGSREMPKTEAVVKAGAGSTAYVSGSNCLIAGYISQYNGTKCSVDNIYDSYKDKNKNDLVESTKEECAPQGYIACNPLIYGTPGGKAICVNPADDSFQKATHANGPCETNPNSKEKNLTSVLGTDTDFLKEGLKNGKRYSADNRRFSQDKLAKMNAEEQKNNPALVENFLNGLLSRKYKANVNFKTPLTDDMLEQIINIKQAFDADIDKAVQSCEAAASNKNNEINFWGACDQLHRRFLNVADFLQKTPGCIDGLKTIDAKSLKCQCPSPQAPTLPGVSCATTPPPDVKCGNGTPVPAAVTPRPSLMPGVIDTKPPVIGSCSPEKPGTLPKKVGPKENCQGKYPSALGMDENCMCPGGDAPQENLASSNETNKAYDCKPKYDDGKGADKGGDKGDCGFLCSAGKATLNFIKNWGLTIAGTGLVVFAAYKLLQPKKPTTKSAGDSCGITTTCPQTCTSPLALQANGACACTSCVPPQVLTNSATCACGTSTTTTTYTCPDGVTKTTDQTLASCPVSKFTCWDGTIVEVSPLRCPEKPASTSKPSKATK